MLGSFARKNISLSSVGATFQQPAHWSVPLGSLSPWGQSVGRKESISADFESIVEKAYKENGIVFACVLARAMPFSEARFQFQELHDGRPGRLFDHPSLRILDVPWPNATTGELLWRMEQDGSLAGNCFLTRVGSDRIRRLRPDWMTIITGIAGDPDGSAWDMQAEVLGYIYQPRNIGRTVPPVLLSPERVAHFSPIPDPAARWRGMSWLQPVLSEVEADSAATEHKGKYFQNGATGGIAVTYDASVGPETVRQFKALFDEAHSGTTNAYKTYHFGGGADAKTIGADLKQLDFKATQGAGETRIAAAAGVGAIMARFSEGMQGSSLNEGNYDAAKRQFADMTLRPLWRTASATLTKFAPPPRPDSRLWFDVRDIEFLKDGRKDQNEILASQASTIRSLVDAGYEPDAVIDAVEAGDLSRLTGKHSGLYSVQLQAPGSRNAPKKLPGQQELEV